MPGKYHLEAHPTPPRFVAPGKAALLDWEEGCLKCARCVKLRCTYQVYRKRKIDDASLTDTADSMCKQCFQCVQNCPKRLISQTVNPDYRRLGDPYWTPEILTQLYNQAEKGSVPVSGGGYGGPFSGPGFDAMWTDMSEIVRPTRDGIHGREYISTSVDLGRKPYFVRLTPEGEISEETYALTCFIESPFPYILAPPTGLRLSPMLIQALIGSARDMKGLAMIPAAFLADPDPLTDPYVIPWSDRTALLTPLMDRSYRAMIVDDHHGVESWITAVKKKRSNLVAMVRLPLKAGFMARVLPLVRAGVDVIQLQADDHGRQFGDSVLESKRPFIKDLIRQVHNNLVEEGHRDQVTLLAGGGLAMAEHAPKAIICGADAVVVDVVLWAAMECRLCRNCLTRPTCPVELENVPLDYAKARIRNLTVAWRNQLLEVLGAMGLREVRRLRGEVGRAMFFEQLEQESFGPIFGRRRS